MFTIAQGKKQYQCESLNYLLGNKTEIDGDEAGGGRWDDSTRTFQFSESNPFMS